MKEYFLGIVAVALLVVIAELLISEGEMKKYIIGIIRIALIISIIMPIFNIFSTTKSNNFDLTENLSAPTLLMDRVNAIKNESAAEKIEDEIKKLGISSCEVNIVSYHNGEKYVVTNVTVECKYDGINEGVANIISTEEIKSVIQNYIDIRSELIEVYEYP